MVDQKRLFLASCLALIATAMAFSIRTDIMGALSADFSFTGAQMGIVAGTGLWGFAITIVIGGMLLDIVGMGRLMAVAFLGHVLGVVLTIFATGFGTLYVATLLIGLANGLVEAVINPLTATTHKENKTRYLNILHAWWPGGLILGGLMGFALSKFIGVYTQGFSPAEAAAMSSLGWKIKMGFVLIPTFLYGFLLLGQKFPETERVASGVSYGRMWKEISRPLMIVFLFLMMLTAAAELGPGQWVANLLANMLDMKEGAILVLVYTAGVMFVLRQFFSGVMVEKFTPLGVLMGCSVLTALGLYWLSGAQTAAAVFLAATVFGLGISYFWPTMLGIVAERFPKGGALALSLMGGAGMFSAGFLMVHAMGAVQDHYAVKELSPSTYERVVSDGGLDAGKAAMVMEDPNTSVATKTEIERAKKVSAVMTYRWVAVIPLFLTFAFGFLFLFFRARGGYKAIVLGLPEQQRRAV